MHHRDRRREIKCCHMSAYVYEFGGTNAPPIAAARDLLLLWVCELLRIWRPKCTTHSYRGLGHPKKPGTPRPGAGGGAGGAQGHPKGAPAHRAGTPKEAVGDHRAGTPVRPWAPPRGLAGLAGLPRLTLLFSGYRICGAWLGWLGFLGSLMPFSGYRICGAWPGWPGSLFVCQTAQK